MIYGPHNVARGTTVVDVEALEIFPLVESVDMRTNELTCFEQPLRVVGDDVARYSLRFRSIYPIFGGSPVPVLFHCYGRLA